LRFDGTNDHLALSNLRYQTLGALSGITIFALVRSSSSANQIIVSFDRGAYWHFALKDSQGLQNVGWATAPSTGNVHDLGTPLSYTDGRWHLICAWFQAGASPDKRLFVDGELVASATAHGGNSLGTGVTRFGFIGVGSEASVFNGTRAPLDFLRADLAEVILYHRALPDDERQQVEQYIVDRYTG
jgi:hypothetical protein